jgi:predicted transcriptional regulator
MRSNPVRDAIMNLFAGRLDAAAPTDATEVHSALEADASPKAVAYHLAVLVGNGILKSDDTERFQPA